MKINDIVKKVDHTLLSVDATTEMIRQLCDEAIKMNAASVCVAPCYVAYAKNYVKDKMKICTVIGFPNGYNTTETKCFETCNALIMGADEIDMVINVGAVKEKNYDYVYKEISAVRQACKGKILKVIIETCLLNNEEKLKMCQTVIDAKADYIKTSTGFSKSGASIEDIKMFKEYAKDKIKIKASGGIHSLKEAEEFINAGADRIGASSVIKNALNNNNDDNR